MHITIPIIASYAFIAVNFILFAANFILFYRAINLSTIFSIILNVIHNFN